MPTELTMRPQGPWGARARVPVGGGGPGVHLKNVFWNMFVYWELHYIMDVQAVELSVGDLVLTL